MEKSSIEGVRIDEGELKNIGRDKMDYKEKIDEYMGEKMRMLKEIMKKGEKEIIFEEDKF